MVGTCAQLQMLQKFLGVTGNITKKEDGNRSEIPVLKTDNGETVSGVCSVAKYLARKSTAITEISLLYEGNSETAAFIDQWLEYRVNQLERCGNDKELQTTLQELDAYLSQRVYFVGSSFTLADIFMYYGLHNIIKDLTFYEKERFIHLSRWFKNIQQLENVSSGLAVVFFQRNLLYGLH